MNVNQRERLVALRTLVDLIDHQPITAPGRGRRTGAFSTPPRSRSRALRKSEWLNEGGFEARVTEVTAVSGNLVLNAQPSDFAAADIAPGTWFELIARGRSSRVLYGRDFTSVKRGQWVAFPNADGFFDLGATARTPPPPPGSRSGGSVVVHRIPGPAVRPIAGCFYNGSVELWPETRT